MNVSHLEPDIRCGESLCGLRVATVNLLPAERRLYEFLRANAGRLVARDELAAKVWQRKMDPRSRTIDQTIATLRKKLPSGEIILTHRSGGYEFEVIEVTGAT